MKPNKTTGWRFVIISVMMPFLILQAQVLRVRNVRFTEQEDVVIVKYDLDGEVGQKYKVSLLLSSDAGKSFKIRPQEVRGDVGRGVKPGTGKTIVWHVREDFPYGLIGDGFVFAVDAELQKDIRLPYYLLVVPAWFVFFVYFMRK